MKLKLSIHDGNKVLLKSELEVSNVHEAIAALDSFRHTCTLHIKETKEKIRNKIRKSSSYGKSKAN